jgi:hypothetical protein
MKKKNCRARTSASEVVYQFYFEQGRNKLVNFIEDSPITNWRECIANKMIEENKYCF